MNPAESVLKFALAAIRAGAGQFTHEERRREIRYLERRLASIHK